MTGKIDRDQMVGCADPAVELIAEDGADDELPWIISTGMPVPALSRTASVP